MSQISRTLRLLPCVFLACACSAHPVNPSIRAVAEPPPTASPSAVSAPSADVLAPSATSDAVSPVAPSPEPGGKPVEAATSKSDADGGARACSADMKLVDGDYCTDVEQKCDKSWYDKVNKKTVCELFESPSKCVGKREHKRFCIDTYTWPNVKGARPEVMNNFYQAQVKCAAIGRRLCTESEWTFACEGPEMKPYPYGYTRDPNKCLGDLEYDFPDMKKVAARDPDELARLWRGRRNGTQPQCISDFGVADLPGNNDEVAASETTGDGWKGKFDSVTTGGPWYKGVRNQCRPKIYTHNEGFYYYYLGFRCCSEADGKPTDPRTPKQIKRNWKFDRVEKLARFTVDDVKKRLELKRTQPDCGCAKKDVLCKTICGTLLGPTAKDAQ